MHDEGLEKYKWSVFSESLPGSIMITLESLPPWKQSLLLPGWWGLHLVWVSTPLPVQDVNPSSSKPVKTVSFLLKEYLTNCWPVKHGRCLLDASGKGSLLLRDTQGRGASSSSGHCGFCFGFWNGGGHLVISRGELWGQSCQRKMAKPRKVRRLMPQSLSGHRGQDRVTEQFGVLFEGQKAQPHEYQERCL